VIVIFLVLVLGLISVVTAGNTDNHTVTVTVSAINEVAIIGGNVSLTINTSTGSSEPDSQTDNTTADLNSTTNESTKKITIGTTLVSPTESFTVEAINISGGSAAGPITLSGVSAQNFITGISQTMGTCDLQYVASATAAQGTGSDAHTVTFTLNRWSLRGQNEAIPLSYHK